MSKPNMKFLCINTERRKQHPARAKAFHWLRWILLGRFVPEQLPARNLRTKAPHGKADDYLQQTRKRILPRR